MRIRSLAPGSAATPCPRPRPTSLVLPLLLASLVGCKAVEDGARAVGDGAAQAFRPDSSGESSTEPDPAPKAEESETSTEESELTTPVAREAGSQDPEGAEAPALGASEKEQLRVQRVRIEEGDDGYRTVNLTDFEAFEVGQRSIVWCWAACTQMVLAYDGEPVTQEGIAGRVAGYQKDAEGRETDLPRRVAASYHDLLLALAPGAPRSEFETIASEIDAMIADLVAKPVEAGAPKVDVDEENLAVYAIDKHVPKTSVPFEELELGNPVVVGLKPEAEGATGHICVLVGATYKERTTLSQGLDDLEQGLGKIGLGGKIPGEARKVKEVAESAGARKALERFEERYELRSVTLVDPRGERQDDGTFEPKREVMSVEDFEKRIRFATTRADAHEILTGLARAIEVED